MVISDITALENGPIEFYTHDCKIENPYFLYDPSQNMRVDHYPSKSVKMSDSTFAYIGVEQLPAELPKDASQMFSEKMCEYIP